MTTGLGRKPTDADYGLGEHSLDGDRFGMADENELTERLIETFASPSYQPPRLPAVATELMVISRQPDVEFKAIEALLEKDAMLAGEVMSLARSAFYSGARPVRTLGAALVRIGLTALREIVLRTALNLRVFRSAAYRSWMERLRQHCVATANLCRILSKYTRVTQDRAFLSGLLHDVGIAGILLVLGDVEKGKQPPELVALWPAIHAAHARAGARMVELWGLPEEISIVVAAHHEVRMDDRNHPMAAAVCLAEHCSAELNLGVVPHQSGRGNDDEIDAPGFGAHPGIDASEPAVIERAMAVLRLDESMMARFRTDARQWAADIPGSTSAKG